MEKQVKNDKNTVKVGAHAKNLRISPSKIDKVIKKIRGKKYLEALSLLKMFPQKPGAAVWDTLYSAASNANNNFSLAKENLFISEAYVNQASILKRMRPRARGKAYRIEKKLCHLSIFVKEL
jgi:large subunit ribosomal protein L22